MVVALLTLGALLFAALVVVTSPVVPIVGWWADAARSPWPGSDGDGVGVGGSHGHGDSSSCGSGGGSSCGGGSSSSCGSGG